MKEEMNISDLQIKYHDAANRSLKTDVRNVFAAKNGYINGLELFTAYFNAIPNFIQEINIDYRFFNSSNQNSA